MLPMLSGLVESGRVVRLGVVVVILNKHCLAIMLALVHDCNFVTVSDTAETWLPQVS